MKFGDKEKVLSGAPPFFFDTPSTYHSVWARSRLF